MNTNEPRARGCRGEGRRKRQRDEERQRKPRRQSGGSFVTVMASTPGLRPPGPTPPSRLPVNTRPTRAQLSSKSIYLCIQAVGGTPCSRSTFPTSRNTYCDPTALALIRDGMTRCSWDGCDEDAAIRFLGIVCISWLS